MALSKTYQTGSTAGEKHSVLYQLAFNSYSPTGLFRNSEGFKALKTEILYDTETTGVRNVCV